MGNAISKLAVLLTANVSGFTSGMRSAVRPVTELASHVTAVGTKIVGLGGALTAFAAGAGMTALVKSSMETIDSTAKLSDRLGITTEAMVGLQHAANLSGVSGEQLTGALEKMLKSLGEAATEGGAAGAALDKLGLKADQLVNAAPDEAFVQIAEGLKNISNPAERATVAMDIFGKAGQSLLPLMLSGAEGIKAAMEEAKKLGLTFSRVDAAKVEAANDAMSRLQAVFVGVARTLAVQLAPFIEVAATKLTELGVAGTGSGSMVVNAFEGVVTAVATAADYLNLLKAGWHGLRVVASSVLWGLLKPVDALVQSLDFLYQKLTGSGPSALAQMSADYLREVEKDIKGSFDAAGDSMLAFSEGSASKAVAKTFADLRASADENARAVAENAAKMRGAAAATEDWAAKLKEAETNAKKVTDTVAAMQQQVQQFGMGDSEKKLADLAALGATPDQLDQAKKALDQLNALNDAKKKSDEMQQRAKSVLDSLATPTERYDKSVTELSELLDAGLLSWEMYARGVRKAREELEKSADAKVPEAPDAPSLIRAGSAEALKLAFQNSTGVQKLTGKDVQREQLAVTQQSSQYLRDILRQLRGDGISQDEEVETLDI